VHFPTFIACFWCRSVYFGSTSHFVNFGPSCQVVAHCQGSPAQLGKTWGHLRTEMTTNCPVYDSSITVFFVYIEQASCSWRLNHVLCRASVGPLAGMSNSEQSTSRCKLSSLVYFVSHIVFLTYVRLFMCLTLNCKLVRNRSCRLQPILQCVWSAPEFLRLGRPSRLSLPYNRSVFRPGATSISVYPRLVLSTSCKRWSCVDSVMFYVVRALG
jgi:hypothetical protein